MNRKTLVAVLALALVATAACGNDNHGNANHANTAANSNAKANTNAAVSEKKGLDWNITKADFEAKMNEYKAEAGKMGDKLGNGANDAWIWTKVKGALAGVDDLKDSAINVDVNDGVVTLRGNVTGAQKPKAAAVVVELKQGALSKDIKDIKNELTAS